MLFQGVIVDLNCEMFVFVQHLTFSGREFQRTGASYILKKFLQYEDALFTIVWVGFLLAEMLHKKTEVKV